METAKSNKNLSLYVDSMLDAMMSRIDDYQGHKIASLADLTTIYAFLVQSARRLELAITKAADLELQEVKPVVTNEVADAALNLAARATRHYFVDVEYNAADGAGLEDE